MILKHWKTVKFAQNVQNHACFILKVINSVKDGMSTFFLFLRNRC